VATRLDRQWRFRRRGKLLPACTPLPHPNHTPTTLRSIQLTQTNQRQFYSWQPRHRYRHRPLLSPAPPPPQPSITPNTTCMSSGTNTNAGTTHQPHCHYHAAPPIPRRLPGQAQAPYPISVFPLLFLPARNTYPAIPMPLGSINHIATTTGPRPTRAHGGCPPPALHTNLLISPTNQ